MANRNQEVLPHETWSSLAMKHYGDALLGVRLAEANGVDASVKPATVAALQLPPVEQLDPGRGGGLGAPAPGSVQDFADDEASVVKEARYRMVMALGGSGAVNASPASVSSRKVERREAPREERIEEAVRSKRDLAESLDSMDGKALLLDVKPSRHDPRPERPSTKDSLAPAMAAHEGRNLILDVKAGELDADRATGLQASMAAHDGKALILDVKPGAGRDEDEDYLADALAEKDGRALILDVKPRKKKKKKKKKGQAESDVAEEVAHPFEHVPMGERFGDDLAKLDGKAMVLDVKAASVKQEDAESRERKRKDKATQKLFDGIANKELVLDVSAKEQNAEKHAALKERRKRAKKRKRRSGAGSLIPAGWKAEGVVSVDDIEDYIDELRDQREYEEELFGDDQTAGDEPVSRAARGTAHRSAATARSSYDEDGEATGRPETEGYGAFDEMQSMQVMPQRSAVGKRIKRDRPARPRRERPEAPRAVEEEGSAVVMPDPTDRAVAADRAMHPARPGPRPRSQARNRPVSPQPSPVQSGTSPASRAAAARRVQPRSSDWDGPAPDVSDWDDDPVPAAARANDWDDDESLALSGITGMSMATGLGGGALPAVSPSDPYAPEAMARLCMLSPGSVMRVARTAPVGAGAVLDFIGHMREAKSEGDQADLVRRFINEHREQATVTLEQLLTA